MPGLGLCPFGSGTFCPRMLCDAFLPGFPAFAPRAPCSPAHPRGLTSALLRTTRHPGEGCIYLSPLLSQAGVHHPLSLPLAQAPHRPSTSPTTVRTNARTLASCSTLHRGFKPPERPPHCHLLLLLLRANPVHLTLTLLPLLIAPCLGPLPLREHKKPRRDVHTLVRHS